MGNPLMLIRSYILHHSKKKKKSPNLKNKFEMEETDGRAALYPTELDHTFITEFS